MTTRAARWPTELEAHGLTLVNARDDSFSPAPRPRSTPEARVDSPRSVYDFTPMNSGNDTSALSPRQPQKGLPLPNLVIAGVGKSGTTSLFWYLSQHPEICASQLKEVDYFSPLRHGERPVSLKTYAGYFSHWTREPYRMEASPSYFYGGEAVIREMYSVLDRPRVLISLRDPVARLWSAYSFLKSMGRLDKDLDFETYVDHCQRQLAARSDSSEPDRHTPLSVGFYNDFLQPWFKYFGRDVRIVFAEDLFSRPLTVVTGLCQWLDIDDTVGDSIDYRVHNETVRPKSHQIARWAYEARAFSDQLFRRSPATRTALRRIYAAINGRGTAEGLDPQMRHRLQELYRESNAATARTLFLRGYRDLPAWLTAS